MSELVAWVFMRRTPEGFFALVQRLLEEYALGRSAWILFRLGGVVPLQRDFTVRSRLLPPEVRRWLKQEGFKSLHAYWWSAYELLNPRCYVCSTTLRLFPRWEPPSVFKPTSVTRFLVEAKEAGAMIEWLD